jgi:GrpB-like predicted nucleotidyltransferase (UPF0157 family)
VSESEKEALDTFEVVTYDSRWANIYRSEHDALLALVGLGLLELEHIGSTAVPNLRAKPIIDMMGAVAKIDDAPAVADQLGDLGYRLVDTDMRDRLFLRKRAANTRQIFHLHLVGYALWGDSNERIMRDFLLDNPEDTLAYGALKERLAAQFADDSLAYTKAKTPFIQQIINRARDQRGLPRVPVWPE